MDRRTLLRLAGLSALGFAVAGCERSESPAPCSVDLDESSIPPTVEDGFSGAGGSLGLPETGQEWRQEAGTWRIVGGRAMATARYRSQVCTAVVETGSADGRLDLEIALSSTPGRVNAGTVFRSVDPDTNLFVKLERTRRNPDGLLAIGKKQEGRVTYLATRTSGIGFDHGQNVRLVVELAGPDIRVRVSTCEVLEHRLGDADLRTFGARTLHGLRVNVAPDDDDGGSGFDAFAFTTPV
jgi:hypothetical protein